MIKNEEAESQNRAMEKYRIYSRHIIDAPFEAEIKRLDRLKERVVDVLTQPVMNGGVAFYVLALWLIEHKAKLSVNRH
jgi:hypothetical protein